jgi:hypothetical protein
MPFVAVRRFFLVLLALGVVATASVWVSAVRFKDAASATDCGVPLGAALHGRQTINTSLFPIGPSSGATAGVVAVPVGTKIDVTVCAGEARTRVAIAATAIVLAAGGVFVSMRRGRRSPPGLVPA